MGDGLAIASGVAGLLSLGIQVTQSLVEFYTSYKQQDTDIEKVTQNLDNLQNIFLSLDIAVHDRRSQPYSQNLIQGLESALRQCEEIIRELQLECEKFYNDSAAGFQGRVKVAGRRAAYPFRKSTIQKLEEDISEVRENLLFALNVLQLENHKHVEDGISELRSLVERTNACQASFAARAWLAAPDAFLDHRAACTKRHPSTGLWLLDGPQFRNWFASRSSFLWLHGFAGCGKSVLCSTAIQHTFQETRHQHRVGVAFFYFSFNDETKQDSSGMLRALLLQLSSQLEDGETELEQLQMSYKSRSPPVEAFLDSLRHLARRFHDIYLFLDALDESPGDQSRAAVLRALRIVRSWSMPGLHILVTSRDELDIRESLNPSPDQDLPMRNLENSKDIENFITYQLKNDLKLQRWKKSHWEIQTKLTKCAQGVFRYVECEINALRRARNRNQLDECLRSLPRDLDGTYERILCSISDDFVEDVRRVLTVLCCSARPLTVNELMDAHAVDLNEPPRLDRDGRLYEQDDLVDICRGLVEIYPIEYSDGNTVLAARIAHFSVQEYLQSGRILQQNLKRFSIPSSLAHTEMARICLVYLLDPALSNGPLNETRLREYPLAHFAAIHWFHHYTNSKDKSAIEKLILRLFQDKENSLATWIRLHDFDHQWKDYVDFHRPVADVASPLYYAALLGLESVLETMLRIPTRDLDLQEEVDINAQCGHFGNALQAASFRGLEKVVWILLNRGADVNAQGGAFNNPLSAASFKGHLEVVKILLSQGADANIQGGHYGNALQIASLKGNKKLVHMLLDSGAALNSQCGEYGTALQAASFGGHLEIVEMLLDRGANVNTQGGHYGNALQAASFIGHEVLVQLLVDQGANINNQGGHYGNPLQAASLEGHKKLVQMLLDVGAHINIQGGYYGNALQAASWNGHTEVVQMLLDSGANLGSQCGEYGSALQAASFSGHLEIVELLLDRGANVNSQGGHHGNALQNASWNGHAEVVKMILKQGADINIQGEFLGNATLCAALRGHVKVVLMLLDEGADINAQDPVYGNALQAASMEGHEELVRMLLDRGADLNAQCGQLGSAIQAASWRGEEKVVQLLLNWGADAAAQGGRYGNATRAAFSGGHESVVQILQNWNPVIKSESKPLGIQ